MEHLIIGTAGHVDHGKTRLVKALTGVDTDLLKEEKERGISIDLGIAHFRLPEGRLAGVIDVPGHERFLHNMLAGIGGIDLVLFVIDVMEGIMPQTREHLQILELLNLKKGIIVLTKIDLAEDGWLEIVEEEVRDAFRDTFLEGAPLCAVSTETGEGLDELLKTIELVAAQIKPKQVDGPLRLPVDRFFSIPGFGTVVTGTLLSGRIEIEQTVEVLPPGSKVRVRKLQVYGNDVAVAVAGQRVAVNLASFEKGKIERGSVVATPDFFKLTSQVDARLSLLDAGRELNFWDPVHLHLGTARVVARVALLDRESLEPGESAIVQLRFQSPIVAQRGDRFIIRSYSPMTTIGGGLVIDPDPPKHKRFRKEIYQLLETIEKDDSWFLIEKISRKNCTVNEMARATGFSREYLASLLKQMEKEGKIVALDEVYITKRQFTDWLEKLTGILQRYHAEYPLHQGISRAHLKSSLTDSLTLKAYDFFLIRLQAMGLIKIEGDIISLTGFLPQPKGEQIEHLKLIKKRYEEAFFQPPIPRELEELLSLKKEELEHYLAYLTKQGILKRVAENIYFYHKHYHKALMLLKKHFAKKSQLTLAEFRDQLQSSRKYVQPLLEFFDQMKHTRRVGDWREAWKLPENEED
ncbi:MAG: selenocysteine-specific translation elongation factor [Dethiobacteria bacterium]